MALDRGLIARIGGAVARGRLLAPGEPVVALVSGGADSTLLACALHALGHPLETLHVAHALRGSASVADADACRALAAALGVPHRELDGAVAPGPGMEARARERRRAAASSVRAGRAVATGHTRDDRIETILYRLAASPGSAAFAALPAADGEGRVRPLLELGRDEVRAALHAAGIPWRDDPSNDDRLHARNRVRLDLLPAFRSLHPAADANLLRTAVLLAEDDAALDEVAAGLLAGRDELAAAAVAAAPAAVVRRALRRLAGFPAPRPVAAERVIALARAHAGAGSVPLGAGRIAERRYDRIAIVRGGRRRLRPRARSPWRYRGRLPSAGRSCAARWPPPATPSMPRWRRRSCCVRRVRASGCRVRGAPSPACCSRRRCRAASGLATLSSPRRTSPSRFRASPSPRPCADPLDSC